MTPLSKSLPTLWVKIAMCLFGTSMRHSSYMNEGMAITAATMTMPVANSLVFVFI